MNRKLSLSFVFILLVQSVFSQATEPNKATEKKAELKKQAAEFLRETAADVNNLRTLENRISFSAEIAGLMWFEDEKQSRAMYQTVISDFKQLLYQYNSQLSAFGDDSVEEPVYGGFLSGGDQSEKAKLTRKLYKAIAVRQQVAMSIAEHEPQLAFDFYNDSLSAITNPAMRKQLENRSLYFETRLVKQIADKDPAKAAEFGKKTLAKEFNYEHIDLLKKIYAKDAEKGADFAEAIAGKLKSQGNDIDNIYYFGTLLEMGAENLEKSKKDSKKPMFTEQSLRDMADVLAQKILKNEDGQTNGINYIKTIEKISPSRGVQLRARFQKQFAAMESAKKAVVATKEIAADEAIVRKIDSADAFESLKKLENKELPKEEREKIILEARKIITELPNPQAKIMALSGLAAQVSKMGDKELASQLMNEAQGLASPQPKNYMDYMAVWMLAGGYAQAEPEKAFPLLQDTIFRLNDTLAAFIKVGEFIDVQGEMIEDGEVQVGAFGGSMVRELTGGLGAADSTIRNMAVADFEKMKGLTNGFDRPEIRVLAKMLVLRAVVDNAKKAENPDEITLSEGL